VKDALSYMKKNQNYGSEERASAASGWVLFLKKVHEKLGYPVQVELDSVLVVTFFARYFTSLFRCKKGIRRPGFYWQFESSFRMQKGHPPGLESGTRQGKIQTLK